MRFELKIEEMEIFMTAAAAALWQQVADAVGVVKAEFASLKAQLDTALADQEAAKAVPSKPPWVRQPQPMRPAWRACSPTCPA